MPNVRRQIELQTCRVRLQGLIQINGAGRIEKGPNHAPHVVVFVTCQYRLALEPANLKAMPFAERHQIIDLERKRPFTNLFGGAFQIGILIARYLLVRANQQMRELSSRGPRLRQELGYRSLQQVLREKK